MYLIIPNFRRIEINLHKKSCKIWVIYQYPGLPILLPHTSVKAFPALVRPPVPDNFMNPPSVNIFLTTPNVPFITIRTNSLPRSSSHFISSFCLGSDFHQISESSSLQTKRIRLLLEDLLNLLNSPLVDRSNVSPRSKLHLQPMTTRLSYLLNPFLLATALTNEISSFLYRKQLSSISTSF